MLFKKSYRLSLLGCLVHLLPLLMTIFVLQLNFRNVYWTGVNTPNLNARLNALQFAAKLHEILINASIASILISTVRDRLSNEGIPLGSLISSYEISHIGCLWSLSFWGGILATPSKSFLRHRVHSIILSISIILVVITGPLTAIALIPKVDWWLRLPIYRGVTNADPFSDLFTDLSSAVPPHTNALRSQIWPAHLAGSNLPTHECLSSNATQGSMCPVAGYSTLLDYASSAASFLNFVNLSMPGDSQIGGPRRVGCNSFYNGYSVSSSISQLLARDTELAYLVLGDAASSTTTLLRLAALSGSKPLKPVVQVECDLHDPNKSPIEFPHAAFANPPSVPEESTNNIYANESWTMNMSAVWNASYIEGHIEKNSVAFTWTKLENSNNYRPSIAASVAVPPSFIPNTNGSVASNSPPKIYACSLDARWVPAELWITPTLSDSYYESTPRPVDLLKSAMSSPDKEELIDISLEWASALNVPIPDSPLTTIETLLNTTSSKLHDFSDPFDQDHLNQLGAENLAAVLAVLTADGLARVGLNYDLYVPYNSTTFACAVCNPGYPSSDACDLCGNGKYPAISNSANWTSWKIDYYQYGYGYGITNVTTRIAVTVLILYGLIALAAIINILVRNCNSSSWLSLGELLVLATNSPSSTALRNTGAGIGRLNTWKEVVRVRATEEEQLMMIFEDHEGFDKCDSRKPKVGEKYE